MRELCAKARVRGGRIGLVPTMGALHAGHRSLMARTRELVDVLVVSIFVNPTQFGAGEDFEQYPRDLPADVDLCVAAEVDTVFAPELGEIYPPGDETRVEVGEIARRLEGASRPDHFRGVATVLVKLFHIAQPTIAAFGQKDAQQCALVRRLVQDLMLDVEILIVPTVRDEDGLALSSRNRYLTPAERRTALAIPRALAAVQEAVASGARDAEPLTGAARAVLGGQSMLEIDYVELVDPRSFLPCERLQEAALLAVAARVGKTRLIDNVTLHA